MVARGTGHQSSADGIQLEGQHLSTWAGSLLSACMSVCRMHERRRQIDCVIGVMAVRDPHLVGGSSCLEGSRHLYHIGACCDSSRRSRKILIITIERQQMPPRNFSKDRLPVCFRA